MVNKTKFVTLEGIDGAGKTTALNGALDKLKENNINKRIFVTREPGGNKISEQIRNILLDKNNQNISKETEALLFAAARSQHLIEDIKPHLNKDDLIISDRYIDSSLVYQGFGNDLNINDVLAINKFATQFLFPDYVLFFDIKPENALKRIYHNRTSKIDRLDNKELSFYNKVYQGYQSIINKEITYSNKTKYIIINANQNKEKLIDDTYKILLKILSI